MRLTAAAALLAAAFTAALLARGSSTGREIIDTGREYLGSLAADEPAGAYALLSDSLAGLLSPEALRSVERYEPTGSVRTGRMEGRGFRLSVGTPQGGSRTLWLQREDGGGWRISGDTSLDNVLGSATIICSSYARNTVIPALAGGIDAGNYLCPVSGRPYLLTDGILTCPSGHLGPGIDTGGAACSLMRDSLVELIEEYVSAGYEYPSGFSGMFLESGGQYGQRGGYRCPDDGYSYYEITPEGVHCPYHGRTTPAGTPDSATEDHGRE